MLSDIITLRPSKSVTIKRPYLLNNMILAKSKKLNAVNKQVKLPLMPGDLMERLITLKKHKVAL